MKYVMTDKQLKAAENDFAIDHLTQEAEMVLVSELRSDQTVYFHNKMNLPVGSDWTEIPTAEEITLRAKLHLEEIKELFVGMGIQLSLNGSEIDLEELEVLSADPLLYDPIEVADGLADQVVICNGTAAQLGIPTNWVEDEVFASNMTKLDENGNPVINICTNTDCAGCDPCTALIDPTRPKGKLLKPDTYVPANIARLYKEYQDDQGTCYS